MSDKIFIIILVVLAVVVASFLIAAWVKRKEIIEFFKKPETIEFIRSMILRAEEIITDTKAGQERIKWVCEQIIAFAPPEIAKYLSAASMMRMMISVIQKLFDELVHILPDGTRKAMTEEAYELYMAAYVAEAAKA